MKREIARQRALVLHLQMENELLKKPQNQEEAWLTDQIRQIAQKNHRLFGCRKMAMALCRIHGIKIGVKKSIV